MSLPTKISVPKKVSRFKSDRSKRDGGDDGEIRSFPSPASAKKIILGGIVEIKDTKQTPLSEVSCSTPSGFPSSANFGFSFASKSSDGNINKRRPKVAPLPVITPQPDDSSSDNGADDFATLNTKRVASMSEADVQR
jgi:hypothetical protein